MRQGPRVSDNIACGGIAGKVRKAFADRGDVCHGGAGQQTAFSMYQHYCHALCGAIYQASKIVLMLPYVTIRLNFYHSD